MLSKSLKNNWMISTSILSLGRKKDNNYKERLLKVIPGGCHTYSRGFDQFPNNAPDILDRGKGAYVWDMKNNRYIDYGMGLRSVTLGYANRRVNRAAYKQIQKGNGLTRASSVELEAAEEIINVIPCAEMVKFAKNGSNVTTAACKIARAYNGKKYIAIPEEQPFFSFDDWFIGKTKIDKGIPKEHSSLTLKFQYGNIQSVKRLFEQYPGMISAIMLEPSTHITPCNDDCNLMSAQSTKLTSNREREDNFLVKLKEICNKNSAILIFDEMITGFRWDLGGAQSYFGVEPDMATFGKAMANGFSLAALVGRRELLELGNIIDEGKERTFLLSSTHGAEMSSLGAFLETIKIYKREEVTKKLWEKGSYFKQNFNEISRELGIEDKVYVEGPGVALNYRTKNINGDDCLKSRTFFAQELASRNILMPWISLSTSHTNNILDKTLEVIKESLAKYKDALNTDLDEKIKGHVIKPVFRKYN